MTRGAFTATFDEIGSGKRLDGLAVVSAATARGS